MSSFAPHAPPSNSWQSLVSRAYAEVKSKIEQDKPELLRDTFLEPMRFLPMTPSSREVIDVWLQSERHRSQIAEKCRKDLKDITRNCVEMGAAFICLKVEKPSRIAKPMPDKTLVIIGLGRLHAGNGMFDGIDLPPGESATVSGDKPQIFVGDKKGGGIGIVLRIGYQSS